MSVEVRRPIERFLEGVREMLRDEEWDDRWWKKEDWWHTKEVNVLLPIFTINPLRNITILPAKRVEFIFYLLK